MFYTDSILIHGAILIGTVVAGIIMLGMHMSQVVLGNPPYAFFETEINRIQSNRTNMKE